MGSLSMSVPFQAQYTSSLPIWASNTYYWPLSYHRSSLQIVQWYALKISSKAILRRLTSTNAPIRVGVNMIDEEILRWGWGLRTRQLLLVIDLLLGILCRTITAELGLTGFNDFDGLPSAGMLRSQSGISPHPYRCSTSALVDVYCRCIETMKDSIKFAGRSSQAVETQSQKMWTAKIVPLVRVNPGSMSVLESCNPGSKLKTQVKPEDNGRGKGREFTSRYVVFGWGRTEDANRL